MTKMRVVNADGSSFFLDTPLNIRHLQLDVPLSMKPAWKYRTRKATAGMESFQDLFFRSTTESK
eukprot:CAMPEP_0197536394 /NCGR_PEP_ID=MMETSP1318-20131121/53768_1 /TAXON_ID=552666 /ORGANISM="Partenskyella glossopodia, Strain RCC365" /LENGTH=63 /DNA_ID=CAMNT_0043094271 /DNA_START=118 /DNA_END=309 /DNA_ORIENTATION=-